MLLMTRERVHLLVKMFVFLAIFRRVRETSTSGVAPCVVKMEHSSEIPRTVYFMLFRKLTELI